VYGGSPVGVYGMFKSTLYTMTSRGTSHLKFTITEERKEFKGLVHILALLVITY